LIDEDFFLFGSGLPGLGENKKASSREEAWLRRNNRSHLPEVIFCRNWHRKSSFCPKRLPGCHRAGPSTPLDEHRVLFSIGKEIVMIILYHG
jgi:hypothetical protein